MNRPYSKLIISLFIFSFLTACSGTGNWFGDNSDPNYDGSTFQKDASSGGGKPRMKITRGSGYGEEVPFESKYSHA